MEYRVIEKYLMQVNGNTFHNMRAQNLVTANPLMPKTAELGSAAHEKATQARALDII